MDLEAFAMESMDAVVLLRRGRVARVNAVALRRFGDEARSWIGRDADEIDWPAGAGIQRYRLAPALDVVRLKPGSQQPPGVDEATERMWRAAQERLAQLSTAINQASDQILTVDAHTLEYVEVNEACARIFGLSRDELLARGSRWVWDRMGVDPDVVRRAYMRLVRRSPEVITQEVRVQHPDGSDMYVEFSRRAVRAGDRWLIISIGHDVTARKQGELAMKRHLQELRRSNEELERFAYVTSHDLTEPLRMIASYAQLLNKRYAGRLDDSGREFLDFMIDGARRMKRLIDDLLLYSRASRVRVQAQSVALDDVLNDALANLSEALRESGAVVEREPLPVVHAEPLGMEQLFQNLIANAIKFRGDRRPVVRIAARDAGASWEIAVSDNGIGIEPQYHERIFVIFQRLHGPESYEGTGIGLAVCKTIVERHGGRIWVESRLGEGTSFRFRLPKTALADAAHRGEPASSSAPGASPVFGSESAAFSALAERDAP